MNKVLASIVLGFSIVCMPVAEAENSVSTGPTKVGAILSLTGELSSFGQAMRQGIELALSEGKSAEFDVMFEDDRSLNRVDAVNATKKLISSEKVAVILNMVVNTVTALSPILTQSKTVGLVIWDSNKTIADLGEYVFGLGYSTELAGEDLAQFAYDKLAIRDFAIISAHDEWSELISEAFKHKLVSLGAKLAFHEKVNVDQTDFKTLIAKAKQRNVQSLYAPLFGRALVSWIKQSRELGYKGLLLTGDGVSENELKQAGVQNSEGLIASQVWITDPDFKKRYLAKFGASADESNIGFVAMGYDSIQCLSQAKQGMNEKGISFTSETLKIHLRSFTCTGVTGTTRISEKRTSNKRESILVANNGHFQPALN